MTVAEKAREFLTLQNLQLPPSPRIVELEVEDMVDWTGEDALRVNAYLDEATTDDDLKARSGFAIKDAIWELLRQHGIELFPYIRFAKRSELEAARKERIEAEEGVE